jgi:dihydrofolate reductase
MIGIIAATSINGVIGIDNKLPFHYPDDMRHFRQMTHDSVVIMGRKTFESIGKPLPKRENIIITKQNLEIPGARCFASVAKAIGHENIKLRDHAVNIWFIGGAKIYEEGMLYADEIYLTLTPDYIDNDTAVKFPFINPLLFDLCGYERLSDPPSDKLLCAVYKRRKQNSHYEKVVSNIKIHRDR